MQSVISRVFKGDRVFKLKKLGLILTFYGRFIGIGIISVVLIRNEWVQPAGLVIGLSSVVLGIVSYGVSTLLKSRAGEVI
jgi:hypothetical protein